MSGCTLVELRLFNGNKVRNMNKHKRSRHNKCLNGNPDHKFVATKKIDYWRVFEIKFGCLLLECSIRSNGAYDHLLVLNFSEGYIYECGYEYQPFTIDQGLKKESALKLLAKFNIADIKRVWLITRRTDVKGVPLQSVYGALNLARY